MKARLVRMTELKQSLDEELNLRGSFAKDNINLNKLLVDYVDGHKTNGHPCFRRFEKNARCPRSSVSYSLMEEDCGNALIDRALGLEVR